VEGQHTVSASRQFAKKDLAVAVAVAAAALCNLAAVGTTGRETAKAFVCQSNLKKLGGAMTLYLGDNDDQYPSPWLWLIKSEMPVMGYQRFCRWHDPRYPPDGPLWNYLVKDKIALCPTFGSFPERLAERHPMHDSSIPIEPQFSYSMNVFLGTRYPSVYRSAEITRSKAKVFVFAEENLWPRPGFFGGLNDTVLYPDGRDWFGTFHHIAAGDWNGGTINAAFADGHLQKVRSGLTTTKDGQADYSNAEYGHFEKYGWPFEQPPK
jgi:prepilin-type processing-associated H-X9-DG protein